MVRMSEKIVLSSGSLGYELFDVETQEISLHKSRGTISYKGANVLIGDAVKLDERGFISEILPRKNVLSRPKLSNVDFIFVVISYKKPAFSSYLLDKFLTLINSSNIKAKILITKVDLASNEEFENFKSYMSYYEHIGYDVYYTGKNSTYDLLKIKDIISDKKVAFVGQTGVGKSTLLNQLCPDFNRKIDELYINSGRGRHTTKEVVLLPFNGGFLFDTPGFSQLELKDFKPIDLAAYFPGIKEYYGKCHFVDCLHLPNTKGCQIEKAILSNMISADSYKNYCKIYEEVKINDIWKKKL